METNSQNANKKITLTLAGGQETKNYYIQALEAIMQHFAKTPEAQQALLALAKLSSLLMLAQVNHAKQVPPAQIPKGKLLHTVDLQAIATYLVDRESASTVAKQLNELAKTISTSAEPLISHSNYTAYMQLLYDLQEIFENTSQSITNSSPTP